MNGNENARFTLLMIALYYISTICNAPKYYNMNTGEEYCGPQYFMEGSGLHDIFGNKIELR